MTQLKEIISLQCVILNTTISSKKKTLEMLAKVASSENADLNEQEVFELLVERERLGSTGFGDGVAIPHCRMAACNKPICIWLRLANPIDFNAIDEKPVDIFVGLIVPAEANEEHLQLLRQVAEVLRDSDVRNRLREAKDSQTLYNVLISVLANK